MLDWLTHRVLLAWRRGNMRDTDWLSAVNWMRNYLAARSSVSFAREPIP